MSDFSDSLTAQLVTGPLRVKEYGAHWNGNSSPAVATQATVTQASAGAALKNVCTSITATLSSTAAPTAGAVEFVLRDGATGVGAIIWRGKLSLQAVAGQAAAITTGAIWIEGSVNTSMTLESVGAPPAATFATVSITGSTTA